MLKVYIVFSDRLRTSVLAKTCFSQCSVITAGISGSAHFTAQVFMRYECAARICCGELSVDNVHSAVPGWEQWGGASELQVWWSPCLNKAKLKGLTFGILCMHGEKAELLIL